jgi:hypothetical protein
VIHAIAYVLRSISLLLQKCFPFDIGSYVIFTIDNDNMLSCVHTCDMFANMTRVHVREHITLSVDGFLYSVRNGLHQTRPRNKFPRNKRRHHCYGYGLMFGEMLTHVQRNESHITNRVMSKNIDGHPGEVDLKMNRKARKDG